IDLEVAAPQGGVLSKISHGDGADVKVGEVLGVIEEDGGRKPRTAEPLAGSRNLEAAGQQPEAAAKPRATPAARNAAQQNAVDLTTVQGTGDAGRVMRRDVESVVPKPAAPVPSAKPSQEAKPGAAATKLPQVAKVGDRTEERVRMSKRRATIAKRLIEAQSTAAMLTTFNEIDMSAVQALRERHKLAFKERHGVSLGLTSFFVKAAIGALREFPRINAEIQGDEMVLKHYYDIGIAVGASEGLVVPVLPYADPPSFPHTYT